MFGRDIKNDHRAHRVVAGRMWIVGESAITGVRCEAQLNVVLRQLLTQQFTFSRARTIPTGPRDILRMPI